MLIQVIAPIGGNNVHYMVELAILYVRKMTHADWLPSRAIRFSYRSASFGGKFSS